MSIATSISIPEFFTSAPITLAVWHTVIVSEIIYDVYIALVRRVVTYVELFRVPAAMASFFIHYFYCPPSHMFSIVYVKTSTRLFSSDIVSKGTNFLHLQDLVNAFSLGWSENKVSPPEPAFQIERVESE